MRIRHLPVDQLVEGRVSTDVSEDTLLLIGQISQCAVSPLIVMPAGQSLYGVLSGNRRLRRIKSLGYKTVPCVVLSFPSHKRTCRFVDALHGIDQATDPMHRLDLIRYVVNALPWRTEPFVVPSDKIPDASMRAAQARW